MQEPPEGMTSVANFAKLKGLSESKAIEMIREGFYIGRKIGDDWFVQIEELSSTSSSKVSANKAESTPVSVVVTDIKMPFISIVIFMVKAALASIPAFIILSCLFIVASIVFGELIGGHTY